MFCAILIEIRTCDFKSYSRSTCSFDFEVTGMISDQIALHSVQSPLLTCLYFLLIFFTILYLCVFDINFISIILIPRTFLTLSYYFWYLLDNKPAHLPPFSGWDSARVIYAQGESNLYTEATLYLR